MTRSRHKLVSAFTVIAILMVAPSSADAKPTKDPRKERQAVRSKKASVAHQLNTLKASSKEVNRALDALDENVAGAETDYKQARRDASQAAASAEDRVAEAAAKQQQLVDKSSSLKALALRAYLDADSGSDGGMAALTGDSSEGLIRSGYSQIYADSFGQVIDEVRQRAQDLEELKASAVQAEALAAQRKADEKDQLLELSQRQDEQQALADKLEARLEAALAESAALASLDANLSDQIAKQDAAIAARLGKANKGKGGRAGATISAGETTSVRGFRVASRIANNVGDMVDAAAEAGHSLGGSGYRDPSTQIALRRHNCGGSDFAVYEMPPSRCRPPTARPGASMHERGLALDLTCDGALITSRRNGCYRWLANHAGSYGFYNLPSEPWHWSVNGN